MTGEWSMVRELRDLEESYIARGRPVQDAAAALPEYLETEFENEKEWEAWLDMQVHALGGRPPRAAIAAENASDVVGLLAALCTGAFL